MKKTVIVLFGGNSCEHDISIITGVEALSAMPAKGYNCIPVYMTGGKWYTGAGLFEIKNYIHFTPVKYSEVRLSGSTLYTVGKRGKLNKYADVDCALLATHGGDGEDGTLQGFLEENGVPHTSAGVAQSAVCMDKTLTKAVLKDIGINVVESITIDLQNYTADDIAAAAEKLKYPLIVKPASLGSSIGISIAKNEKELFNGLNIAAEFCGKAVLEKALQGFTEVNNAAVYINGRILLSEIEKPLTASEFLTYGDKYMGGGKGMGGGMREFPAKLPDDIRNEILAATEKAYKSLGLFGVVRIDYLIADGSVYLNEINTVPGSLAHYLFPKLTQKELLTSLIEESLKRGKIREVKYRTKVLENIGAKHK